MSIIVEFYGIPRERAGCAEARIAGDSVADVLTEIERTFPGLHSLRRADGRLSPHYLLSLEGSHFISDLAERLAPGSRLLLLSADAGG